MKKILYILVFSLTSCINSGSDKGNCSDENHCVGDTVTINVINKDGYIRSFYGPSNIYIIRYEDDFGEIKSASFKPFELTFK